MPVRLSKALEQIVAQSLAEAHSRGLEHIYPDRIFLGMASERNCHAFHILQKLLKEWELNQIKTRIERELNQISPQKREKIEGGALVDALRLRMESVYERLTPHAGILNTGHLLIALLENRSLVSTRTLESYHVFPRSVAEYLIQLPAEEDFYEDLRALEKLNNTRIEIRNFGGFDPSGDESDEEYGQSDMDGPSLRKSDR